MHTIDINPILTDKWRSICRDMAGASMLGDDLYQHCVLKILERGTQGINDLEAYFYLIVKHEWNGERNKFRKQYASCGSDIVGEHPQPPDQVDRVEEIFEALTAEEKALVAAQVIIGSPRQISERYGIPERTIRYNINKIQQKCNNKLKSLE